MKVDVTVTTARHAEGYAVFQPNLPRNKSELSARKTIAGGSSGATEIVGRGGKLVKIEYSTGQELGIWKKIIRLRTDTEIAEFMTRWGSLTDWASEKSYRVNVGSISDQIMRLQELAEQFSGRNAKSAWIMSGQVGVQMGPGSTCKLRAKSLLEFAAFEIHRDLSSNERSSSMHRCAYCNEAFLAERADAKYCSKSHRNLASRNRLHDQKH